MSRRKKLLAAGVAGIALFGWVACAPTDPLPSTAPQSTPTRSGPTEPVARPVRKPQTVKDRIELAIDQVRQRDLLTSNGFWTVFHGILGLGPGVKLLNPETGERINALDHICAGGKLRGLRFIPTKDGLDVHTAQDFVGQGHQDQFVAEVAQWGMPADRKFVVEGKDYTFMDFVRHTQMRARVTAEQELDWAVLVLAQYLGTDLAWTNSFGEKLHFDDLVRYALNAPMDKAACGGTHRLFGLTWAHHVHLQKGGKTEGVWKDVAENSVKHHKLAKKFQNGDGSFSTNWFKGPANAPNNMQLRMNTTGHTLEWLALSLSDRELKDPWVEAAANALALMFLEISDLDMEGGTLYHAVHGLLIYYARVHGADPLGPNRPFLILPPTPASSPTP